MRSILMKGKAWFVGDGSIIPRIVPDRPWYILKLGMGIVGKTNSGRKIFDKKLPNVMLIPLIMVATDREAAKEEIGHKIDAIFDAYETNEELERKVGGLF
jgi:hypothetical protein